MAKKIVLWVLRVVLIVAPAYNLYVFASGEGAGKDTAWWLEQAGFIAWALGSYMMLLIASVAFNINWAQVAALVVGAAGLTYFYLTPEVYTTFLNIPFFQEHKKALPVIPYAYTVIVLILSTLLKTRYGKKKK